MREFSTILHGCPFVEAGELFHQIGEVEHEIQHLFFRRRIRRQLCIYLGQLIHEPLRLLGPFAGRHCLLAQQGDLASAQIIQIGHNPPSLPVCILNFTVPLICRPLEATFSARFDLPQFFIGEVNTIQQGAHFIDQEPFFDVLLRISAAFFALRAVVNLPLLGIRTITPPAFRALEGVAIGEERFFHVVNTNTFALQELLDPVERVFIDQSGMAAVDDLPLVPKLPDIKGIRQDELQGGNAKRPDFLFCKLRTGKQFIFGATRAARLCGQPLGARPTPNFAQGILAGGVALEQPPDDGGAFRIKFFAVRAVIEIPERGDIGTSLFVPQFVEGMAHLLRRDAAMMPRKHAVDIAMECAGARAFVIGLHEDDADTVLVDQVLYDKV